MMLEPMISYAQNFEDVYLRRCFGKQKEGFYIDVGAYHPVHDSVTKFFYDSGWSGINLEANPSLIDTLMVQRPRDINLNLCIDDKSRGNSRQKLSVPFGNKGLGKVFGLENHKPKMSREYFVYSENLSNVISSYEIPDIDFIKIDVEGGEFKVLLGIDLNLHRPKIFLVEIFVGLYDVQNIRNIDQYFDKYNYRKVFCDGINNYYISAESLDLEVNFKFPANVLDNFTKYSEFCLLNENNILKSI
jgi:FkbM family methyltransferase